ncbi:hypothetical protein [Kaistella jeonii]|uniref:DoxX family protein n=1 Tax=Kaistella jeonii TaxID=266749 RepID=A0A0C1F4Q9_9FLAO|nr:hypothetical protein [Kaistella jeonii]KIA88097.1 hypothetical protein OA86_12945 [Kaistella jeonii]SFC32189.1 hypothetical protein SAMN05421876_11386 [Kaistella jeonii]VEI95644.1 Uncharacterised protein [Kaistella jeonii]
MNWKKVHFYLYTFCRYFLATFIISYAFAKILETQFTSQPSVYDRPIGSLSGFQLTWYYYGYSYWYGLVIAVTQIISSILLFFRKTTRLGVILFLTFIVNITLMDFAYGIDEAKWMALLLTMMAFFVLLSDYKAFYRYFITEPQLFSEDERPKWMLKAKNVKFFYIPLVFIGFFVLLSAMKKKYMGLNEFYGTWENTANGDRLYFEAGNSFQILQKNEFKKSNSGIYSFTRDSLKLQTANDEEIFSDFKDKSPTSKPIYYFKGKYKLTGKSLNITSDQVNLNFKRIR